MSRIHRKLVLVCATSLGLVAGAVSVAAPAAAGSQRGMTQVSGVAVVVSPGPAPCDDAAHATADYALSMSGDLEGCIYGTVTAFRIHPSGTYQERADEVFVGDYDGRSGTFELSSNFTAKFDPDSGDQIFGRCQHPIVKGSGTDDFTGVRGRLDFKDDVEAGTAPYRGHLSFG